MTDAERRELEVLVSPAVTIARAVLFLLAVAFVGWLARSIQLGVAEPAMPLWSVPTLIFAAVLYRRAGRWTGGGALRDQIRGDLRTGEVEVCRIVVAAAVEAAEVEDEGPVIFVQDIEGDVHFFAGQEMAEHGARGFPWREIEVSRSCASDRLLSIDGSGGPFTPVATRPPLDLAEARALGVFEVAFGQVDKPWAELTTTTD